MEDEVNDDLSLVIHVNKDSFFLICGCCHAGLINTLERVKELTGKDKCYGIMGGLHLVGASKERIDFTINHLKQWNPEVIIPLHCSGREAMCALKNHFPENTKLLNCGDSFSFQIE
jgi:7,8-dihydropterin-6-yl-methyl-4-(beta-D-ribofuranosyl)aminobenzene 5'-phosphate synthase